MIPKNKIEFGYDTKGVHGGGKCITIRVLSNDPSSKALIAIVEAQGYSQLVDPPAALAEAYVNALIAFGITNPHLAKVIELSLGSVPFDVITRARKLLSEDTLLDDAWITMRRIVDGSLL